MKYPNFNEEKKLWKRGYKKVVGLDEVGRGSLAAPVAAVAVFVEPKTKNHLFKKFKGIKDSKKLSFKKREMFCKMIINHPQIKWGIGRVSETTIDKINILEATKLAMKKAVQNLEKKLKEKQKKGPVDFLLIDGTFGINLDISQKSIIKADEKVFSCTAASIVAKVARDRMMKRYHKKYPQYGFDRHRGYGTKLHREMIKKYGPCKIHRKTFHMVAKI